MSQPTRGARRHSRWHRWTVGIAGLRVVVQVSACGGGDNSTSSATTEGTGTTASAADLLGPVNKASGEPVKIGMVSDGATQAYDNTDELRAAQAAAKYWNEHKGGIGG